MHKRFAEPEGHWSLAVPVVHKPGVRAGDMVWIAGQVDMTPAGEVRNPGDLAVQTAHAMVNVSRVLESVDCDMADLVKLLCFYVNDGSVDEDDFLAMVAAVLPEGAHPAVTAVPVPYLAYPGMMVEIEGCAMRAPDGARMPRTHAEPDHLSPLPAPFAHAVRCGRMIWLSAQAPVDAAGNVLHAGSIVDQTKQVMGQIGVALDWFGADFDDVVKLNRWYVGHGTVADFEPAALACAAHFSEPGPAATGVPVPRHARDGVQIKIEVVAMLGEDGERLPRVHSWPPSLWDWHVHLPYKHGLKCGGMIFLGGQVSLDKEGRAVYPDDLAAQTRQAMTHIGTILNDLGADFGDVCKVTTVYEGACGEADLRRNLEVRSSFFDDPGPASTGVPLPKLAYPEMVIEIDVFAMVDPD